MRFYQNEILELVRSEPGHTTYYYASVADITHGQASSACSKLEKKGLLRCEVRKATNKADIAKGKQRHVMVLSHYYPATAVSSQPKRTTTAHRLPYWSALWSALRGSKLYAKDKK